VVYLARVLQRERGAFLSISAGQCDGEVTISAAPALPGRLIVEAAWYDPEDGAQAKAQVVDRFDAARTLAHLWAARLDAGAAPA